MWVNGVCVLWWPGDLPRVHSCISPTTNPIRNKCRLKENELFLFLSSSQYSWQLFSQLSGVSLFFQIEAFMKENPVCFNNTATVLKYLTAFFFPVKMIMSLEQKMLTQSAKVNSLRRDARTALYYMNMNIVVKYLGVIICSNPSGLTWWKIISLRESEFNSVPALVLLQNHSDHRDNIVGLTKQLKRIEHKLRLTVCCLLFIPIKVSWKVPSFNLKKKMLI